MKKAYIFLFIFCFLSDVFSQIQIFNYVEKDIRVTDHQYNTKAVQIDLETLNHIAYDKDQFEIYLPLIDRSFIEVTLKKFSVVSPDHKLIVKTERGDQETDLESDFQSYYILLNGESIGTCILFEGELIFSYKYNGQQFEINQVDGHYLLFNVNDLLREHSFSCEVEEKINDININENLPESSSNNPECLELAIEVDKYTRNTFSSANSTTNWAHAIMAGVSQVFASEMNLNISIVYTYIWETTDPYSSYTNSASSMLSALKNYWISNNGNISRDLVHLMTKRSNTGTGGIAYRDALCSNNWGYAFSSVLNNNTNFNFPNPSYTWNLFVCSHEIGHNIEAHHTHWCGWPGGPIDNCVDVEGNCSNNPSPQVGTIMSYCHTTSAGALIDFHQIVVNNALITGINAAGCVTTCTFYGCTDPNATNYDPNATVDDGTCQYSAPILSSVITNITCNGLFDGSIDLSVSGGLSPYTFIWSNGSFSEDISNLSAGSYTVTVSDNLGQSTSASYTVNEPTPINAIYTVTNTSGPGMSDGSISVSASGGTPPYTYYWIGSTSTSSTLYNLSSGVYVSYVLDANNCYIVDSLVVQDNVPIPLSASASVIDVDCNGLATGSIDLSVSGGNSPYTYLWDNGSTSEDLSGIFAGTYTVLISDVAGQSITYSVTVSEPSSLSFSYIILPESYNGALDGSIDLTVSGGTPPFSYFWNTNPSQNTEDISNLSAGDYIVYVGFNSWTCFEIDTVTVPLAYLGCTDSIALNYDPLATIDDGSCLYCVYGCTDPLAFNYDVLATCDDGSCVSIVYGCTDSLALNYNLGANIDDGSCIYPIYGCTDSNSCNYNPNATIDDGSCYGVLGCTDPLANNYDPNACIDDGSCLYPPSCGGVTGVYISDIIHKRAIFNWDNMNNSSCQVDQIRFRYRPVGSSVWLTKTMGAPVGSGCNTVNTSKLVRFLTPFTQYEYEFKIWYCNASTVAWHAYGTFTTLQDCENAINFTATPLSTTKTEFCWDSVSTYSFVRMRYREDVPGSTFYSIGGFGVVSPILCKVKNGLTPGLNYRVKWKTYCSPNGGPYRGPQWDGPVLWTQPSSSKVYSSTNIQELYVYPNPSNGIVNIQFVSEDKQTLRVRILNVVGEEIYREDLDNFIGEYTKQVNMEEYSKAIYFLEIETTNGIINKKLILQ